MSLGEKYVKRCYTKFKDKYFHESDIPDFDEIDFTFSSAPLKWNGVDEWGSVCWDGDGTPVLELHPVTRLYPSALKETLLHEMIHIKLGYKLGHGKMFWEEVARIHSLGAYREYF